MQEEMLARGGERRRRRARKPGEEAHEGDDKRVTKGTQASRDEAHVGDAWRFQVMLFKVFKGLVSVWSVGGGGEAQLPGGCQSRHV